MKFMTPDLIARVRSLDDEVSEAAALEWDLRCEEYRSHIHQIRPSLPPGVRRLLRRYSLHDAKILTMATEEVPYFSIILELPNPANPPHEHLELRYRLPAGMSGWLTLKEHPALAGDGKPLTWWMYDEFDVGIGPIPAFTHSILFTGGYEFQLTFFNLSCRRLNFLFPPTSDRDGDVEREVKRLVRLPA